MKIADNLMRIRSEISKLEQHYSRPQWSVKLLAVSKTRTINEIMQAVKAGQLEFGENYCQEAVEKIRIINKPELVWHFIGPIQSNKTTQIATHFDWVHTVDRIKIARRLNESRPGGKPNLNVFVQINISQEKSKAGIKLGEASDFIDELKQFERLTVHGLMALPAPSTELNKQRKPFASIKQIFEKLKQDAPDLDQLSIGTTRDMEAAIAEGATIVRIGTAIFGSRYYKAWGSYE